MLNEHQAWIKIAEAFYQTPSRRGNIQKELASTGMCYAIYCLREDENITQEIKDRMTTTLEETKDCNYHWCPVFYRKSDILRADYCILQACIIESESIGMSHHPKVKGKTYQILSKECHKRIHQGNK